MSGRIPQHFIDELMQRTDIVEVIGSRVQLKKAGREYKACCPFHGEKTPSFTVSPDKGFYHCFGCGAHGTALGFLMEHDRLEFVPAVEELAALYGLDVPREDSGTGTADPLGPLLTTLSEAAEFYQEALKQSPKAVEYLRSRGLDGETAKLFRIGYAPPGWDGLLRQLGSSDEGRAHLLAAGLIIARDGGGHYDRFRDRIMFPIRDGRGRVVGFGGRILDAGEPKYLNSPETPAFHKGQELYGLFEAKQAERKLTRLVVVEGYMDAVSLARHNVRNAVATLGTATTPEHIRRLFRLVPDVVFCFDGDRAGRAAAWRALQTCLPELRDGRQVGFLFLPDGEDPDSLVRKEGAEGFAQRLGQATPLSEYLLDEMGRQAGSDSLDARARMAELAKPLIRSLPEGVYRELLTDRLATAVGLRKERLGELLGEPTGRAAPAARERRPRLPALARPSLIRQAITLLLHYPAIGSETAVPPGLARVEQRGMPLLLELLDLTRQHPAMKPDGVIERFRDRPEGQHLAELLTGELLVNPDAARQELADSLQRIVAQSQKERFTALLSKSDSGQLSPEEKAEFRQLQRDDSAAPKPS